MRSCCLPTLCITSCEWRPSVHLTSKTFRTSVRARATLSRSNPYIPTSGRWMCLFESMGVADAYQRVIAWRTGGGWVLREELELHHRPFRVSVFECIYHDPEHPCIKPPHDRHTIGCVHRDKDPVIHWPASKRRVELGEGESTHHSIHSIHSISPHSTISASDLLALRESAFYPNSSLSHSHSLMTCRRCE